MSVILTLLGIVLAAAGVAAIGFGIPINEFTLGTTLLLTGTTGLTGGLILIGLGAVVSELGRLGNALKARAPARPIARGVEPAEPALAGSGQGALPRSQAALGRPPAESDRSGGQRPRAEAPTREPPASQQTAAADEGDVSASAMERLRSTIPRGERPRGEAAVVPAGDDVPLSPAPKVTADDRAGSAVEVLKASRLDFLFRSKGKRTGTPSGGSANVRPGEPRAPGQTTAETGPQHAGDEAQAPPELAQPEQPEWPAESPAEEMPVPAVLKSGVVDGMAYTLYADGSIEAKLPQGTVRFASIAELRSHIESNS
jgi:hypothetical protein